MLRSDIKIANRILDGYAEDYSNDKRNVIYGTATEEIDHFMPVLNVENKKVLTVAGSGDQILSCALYGAQSVDAFDINPFQLYYSRLKVAAMKALNVDEYNKYFYNNGFYHIYSKELYSKIRDYLDNDTRAFFDSLYKNGFEAKYDEFIVNSHMDEKFSIIPSFTKEDNYDKAKDNLEKMKIKYISADLMKINWKTKEIYDVIMLSNIYKWLNEKQRRTFLEFAKKKLGRLLSDDGIISLYSSASGYREKELEEEALRRDNMDIYTYLENEMITYKKTRSI